MRSSSDADIPIARDGVETRSDGLRVHTQPSMMEMEWHPSLGNESAEAVPEPLHPSIGAGERRQRARLGASGVPVRSIGGGGGGGGGRGRALHTSRQWKYGGRAIRLSNSRRRHGCALLKITYLRRAP